MRALNEPSQEGDQGFSDTSKSVPLLTATFPWRHVLEVSATAAVYYAAARLGLMLQLPGTNASPVWPPSGIGFAAILLFGLRVWPGLAIGAFLANLLTLPYTPTGLLASGAICVGNTLEHVIALLLIRRLVPSSSPFDRARDVLWFVVTAVAVSAIASTNGATVLWLTGITSVELFGPVWFTWWLGDTAGMLVLTPALYCWWRAPRLGFFAARKLELTALFALTALTVELLFGGWIGSNAFVSLPYLVVQPTLLWAAFRFGQRESSSQTVLLSVIAIGHTWWWMDLSDSPTVTPTLYAPFLSPGTSANDSLLVLQIFVCAIAVTSTTLTAAVSERTSAEVALRESERRFRTIFEQAAVGVALIETRTGRIVRINQRYCDLVGYSVAEMTGTSLQWMTHSEDLPKVLENMCLLRAGAIAEFMMEKRYYRKDGSIVWVNLTVSSTWAEENPGYNIAIVEDITDRKRAEFERQRFVALADSSLEFIGMCDREFRPFYVNAAGLRLVGLENLEAASRLTVQDCFFPEDQPFITHEFFPRVLRDGHGEVEIRFRHFQTGEPIWMLYNVTSLRDARGDNVGWATVSRNINDHKRAEEALRESEERLRLAQQVAHIGTFEWNVTTAVNTWTPELEAMYGLQPGEFGKTQPAWEQLVHHEDRAEAIRCVEQAFETGMPTECEWRVVWPDRSVHWIAARFQVFKDETGKPVRLTGINIDITERKRAEERFRLVVEAAPNGMVMVDQEGNIVLVNAQMEKLFGYSKQELVGQPVEMLVPVRFRQRHPEYRTAFFAAPGTRMMGAGRDLYGLCKDGREVPVEIGLNPIHSEAGPLVLASVIDITERQRAEQQIKSTLDQLQGLATHMETVREEERTRIARELHDELGQSLTGLKLELAWIKGRLAKESRHESLALLPAKVDEMSTLIDTTIQSMRRIVTELRPGVLDEFGLAAALEWQGQEFHKRTGICCTVAVTDKELSGDCSSALFRIVQEALTNVARHAGATAVDIRLYQDATSLNLVIADNGTGMSDQTLSSQQSFGLLGMRERAAAVGGTFQVVSRHGQGTKLMVHIPLPLAFGTPTATNPPSHAEALL